MEKMTKLMCVLAVGAGMAMISCQQEKPMEKPETSVEAGVSKVSVSVGAGIVKTRSAVVTEGSTRSLTFTTGDRLYVRGEITGTDPQKIVAGYLDIEGTPDPGATRADFSGTLSVFEFESAGTPDVYSASTYDFADAAHPLAECSSILGWLVHNGAVGFTVDAGQNGAYTNTIAATVDDLMTQSLPVYGYYDAGSFPLSMGDTAGSCTPIFNVNLSGLKPDAEYTLVYRSGDNACTITGTNTLGTITADGFGNAAFSCYVSGATTAEDFHGFYLTNTADGSDIRITTLATKALVSKVYNATRVAYPANVNLDVTYYFDANDVRYYQAKDGQTISGAFDGYGGYVTIADGATVTLNISLPGSDFLSAPSNCDHAAIHCLGDANIILADGSFNQVESGAGSAYPAVFVPEGSTLTISGTGELKAVGAHGKGAGIGGGYRINSGNLIIEGGVISALTSTSYHSAAIGSGQRGTCGNITVTGGVINDATYEGTGDYYGAGIGSGYSGTCGAITIIGGLIGGGSYGGVRVKGGAAIGTGRNGTCGDITIGTGITSVYVEGATGATLIGPYNTSNYCDVYFGDFKAYDKTVRKWYNNDTMAYDQTKLELDCTYGGIEIRILGSAWDLAPATP